MAVAPGMCFNAECQAAMDRAFLTATAVPLLGLAGAIAYRLRPAEWQKREGKQACMPAFAPSRGNWNMVLPIGMHPRVR